MFHSPDDSTTRDLSAPPPVPTAAELRQALSVLHDAVAATHRHRPEMLPPPAAAKLSRELAALFALVGFALHGGATPTRVRSARGARHSATGGLLAVRRTDRGRSLGCVRSITRSSDRHDRHRRSRPPS